MLLFFNCSFGQVEIDTARVKADQKHEFAGVYRSSVSAHFGGVPGVIGFTYDFLLSRRWAFEVGGGFPAAGLGFKFYPFKIVRAKERFHIAQRSIFFAAPWEDQAVFQHAISIGLTFFGNNRWNWGLDLGPVYEHNVGTFQPNLPENGPFNLMINLRGGYRFSFKVMKKNRELKRG